jgi:hypothetical protein
LQSSNVFRDDFKCFNKYLKIKVIHNLYQKKKLITSVELEKVERAGHKVHKSIQFLQLNVEIWGDRIRTNPKVKSQTEPIQTKNRN